jgi:hypothetical protein
MISGTSWSSSQSSTLFFGTAARGISSSSATIIRFDAFTATATFFFFRFFLSSPDPEAYRFR